MGNRKRCASSEKSFQSTSQNYKFPLEFWHPFFVNMVIAKFGKAYHLEEGNIWGEERDEINAYVTCIDPHRIPFSTTLPFNSLWKECHFEVKSWDYDGDQPPKARYRPNENEDARTSLVAAHDKLLLFQTQLSPPPSSSSSTSESYAGAQDGAGDQEESNGFYRKIGPGKSEKGLTRSNGTLHENWVKASSWAALSEIQEEVAVRIGEIPVVCRELCISTLFVGSHAISRHIKSGVGNCKRKTEIEDQVCPNQLTRKLPCFVKCEKKEYREPLFVQTK